ncbi:MAG: substrate-binding domain-containing protein [Rickettsiales bacterium]
MRFFSALVISVVFFSFSASARDQIRIVGSSTVFPFTSAAAEQFGDKTDFKTPVVESTGTGGGIKLFCDNSGIEQTPDIADASRPMKDAEYALCKKNGTENVIEIAIGYDGIVIANSYGETLFELSLKDLFLALSHYQIKDGKLIDNTYKTWKEVNPQLPDTKIEVYGPPPTSGTRDAFVEIVMEKVCKQFPEFEAAYPDEDARKKACGMVREDGAYIDAGENDNIIVQKLRANRTALGIFGFSFLEENASLVQGAVIDGVAPTFDNITDEKYPISRTLYVYVNGGHLGKVPGIKEFLAELVSDDAASEDGYLSLQGLIPLHESQRQKMKEKVENLHE